MLNQQEFRACLQDVQGSCRGVPPLIQRCKSAAITMQTIHRGGTAVILCPLPVKTGGYSKQEGSWPKPEEVAMLRAPAYTEIDT